MAKPGKHTLEEILSQPKSWAKTAKLMAALRGEIAALWAARPWQQVVFTGCGSPYYLSLAAASLFRQLTGRCAVAAPASELWLNPAGTYLGQGDILLVAVSRSGETTEVLRAVEAFKEAKRGQVVVITCEEKSALYGRGDLNIGLPWAAEQSIAQTRSFASMYVAAVGLCAICAGREDLLAALGELAPLGEGILARAHKRMRALGTGKFSRFYFLGSGARYGLASEVSLKMKEMTLTHSEPFHFMEFRHGPKSMVNKRTLVVGLLSAAQGEQELAVLREMQELGATVLALGDEPELKGARKVAFHSALPEEARGVLYLPALHLLAFERALGKGLDPDAPTNLDAVVKLSHA